MTKQELAAELSQPANDIAAKSQLTKAYVAECGHGADLSGLDLSGLNLSNTNLSGANLSGANLQGADLKQCNLDSAQMQNANLQRAQLNNANLLGAKLNDANMQDADCYCAKMGSTTDLKGANLRSTDLRGVTDNHGKDLNTNGLNVSAARNFEEAKGVDQAQVLEQARERVKIAMSARLTEFCENQNFKINSQQISAKVDKLIERSGLSSVKEMNEAARQLLQRGADLHTANKTLLGLGRKEVKVDEEAVLRVFTKAKETIGRQAIDEDPRVQAEQAGHGADLSSSSSSSNRKVKDDLPGNAAVSTDGLGQSQQAGTWKAARPTTRR